MTKSNPITFINFIIIFFLSCTALSAHEFWIEPHKFIVKNSETISGDLRVGQMMKGAAYGYYPGHFKRFEIKKDNIIYPVSRELGAKPALDIKAQGDHLVTIIYETTDNTVFYDKWTKFEEFLIEKNLLEIKGTHEKNNFQKVQFKEIYSRYSKALIGSGKSLGFDQDNGMEIEIVLKANPYIDNVKEGLRAVLFYKGVPKPNYQIEIFSRSADHNIEKKVVLTNEFGEATIAVAAQTDYLLNSVIIRQPSTNKKSRDNSSHPILWESLWASLTFRVP